MKKAAWLSCCFMNGKTLVLHMVCTEAGRFGDKVGGNELSLGHVGFSMPVGF